MSARSITLALLFAVFAMAIPAQDAVKDVTAKVAPFVEKGKTVIAFETADLNGDGFADYLIVVERAKADPSEAADDDKRTLLILTADSKGDLKLAASNDKVVYCRSCGGAFGDPFDGVEVTRNSFTVRNYGGSAWRWSEVYTFNYSRIDKTWQLVKSVSDNYHTSSPNKSKTKIRTPKNFGKINFADFDTSKIK